MCCGRGKARGHGATAQGNQVAPVSRFETRAHGAPIFEYIGRTALTVFGPISGAPYRFNGPGSRLAVDPRDRPALAVIPVLRFVR